MKKPLLSLLFFFLIFAANAQSNNSGTSEKADTLKLPIVEKEASFPGGIDKFFNYITNNLRYPQSALKSKTEGKVSISFVVDKDGSLTDIKVLQGVSPDIDAEAIRLFKSSPRWLPGIQNGSKIREQFSIAVNFKLPAQQAFENDSVFLKKIFSAVEKEPTFNGGIERFGQYLGQNIHYPMSAVRDNLQGKVFITFVVERDGSLTDIKIVKSSGSSDLDAEAVRVMKNCPNWIPGTQRGIPVRVQYTVPVNFTLGKQ